MFIYVIFLNLISNVLFINTSNLNNEEKFIEQSVDFLYDRCCICFEDFDSSNIIRKLYNCPNFCTCSFNTCIECYNELVSLRAEDEDLKCPGCRGIIKILESDKKNSRIIKFLKKVQLKSLPDMIYFTFIVIILYYVLLD